MHWKYGHSLFVVCVQISIVKHFHLIQCICVWLLLVVRGSWSMVCPFIFCLSACLSVVEIRNTVESTKCRRNGKSMENNASKCPVYYLYYHWMAQGETYTPWSPYCRRKKNAKRNFGNVLENVRKRCFLFSLIFFKLIETLHGLGRICYTFPSYANHFSHWWNYMTWSL